MDNQKGWRIKRYITAWPVGPSIASSQTLRENLILVDRQMARIPSIQQLGIRQLGSRELRNSRRDRKCRQPKFERPLWLPRYVLMILAKVFCSQTHMRFMWRCHLPQTLPKSRKHFILQAFAKTRNWTLTHQYHQPTSFDAMFPLIISPTVIAVHSSLESSDSRWFESFRTLSFVWISETSGDQAAIVHATECRNHIGVYPGHMDDQKGCRIKELSAWPLLSDSPWDCFSWLIGKWIEFRPSSSWVFGSWEVVNSGTAGGIENGAERPLRLEK